MLALLCISIVFFCINVESTSWYGLSTIWGLLLWHIYRQRLESMSRVRMYLLATCIACIAVLFPQTDVFSDDAHRYRWDGWVAAHGIDPYSAAPIDASLSQLAHQADNVRYPESINNGTLKTIYPPGAQYVFALIVRVCGTQPIAFKAGWLIVCCSLVAVTLTQLWRRPQAAVMFLLVLLSPVYLLHGFMDIHVDTLMGLIVICSIALGMHSQLGTSLGAVIFGFAITLKYLPLLLLPATMRSAISSAAIGRTSYLIIALTTVVAAYVPFYGSDVLGSLGVFAASWQANSLLASVGNLVMQPYATRIMLMGLAALMMAVVIYRWRSDLLWASTLCITTLLVFSPVVHPWYLALPLMMCVVAPSRSVIVWSITVCTYAYTYTSYKGNGEWFEHPIALGIEFVPVMIAYAIDIISGPLLLGNKQRVSGIAGVDRK
ncbi:MAG: hypothetical protein ACK5GI_07530 [Ignavibacteria bacterium]